MKQLYYRNGYICIRSFLVVAIAKLCLQNCSGDFKREEGHHILFKSGLSFWLERFGYKVAVCNDCYDIFDNGTQPMSIRTFTKHDALPHNSEYVVAVLQAEFRNHFRHLKKCGIKGKCF